MRGKVPNRRSTETKPGITPAYAGKSTCLILFDTLLKDHPRVCGEKRCCTALCRPGVGSPPRMRGKEDTAGSLDAVRGITPAYAGKRLQERQKTLEAWDHPRVCGEKCLPPILRARHIGSPPRMRGKAVPAPMLLASAGITPAYAGKRLLRQLRHITSRDHPRVCGEKASQLHAFGFIVGSPPRMRGKAALAFFRVLCYRITPAYAGKRRTTRTSGARYRDHPRVCGEKTKKIPSHRPFQLHPVPVSFSFA